MEKQVVEVLAQPHPSFVVIESAGQDPVVSVCQEMISRALDFCSQKSNFLGGNGIADALKEGNLAAHEYFRYGLAKEIGSYLGNESPTVKTVYFFEPETMPGEIVDQKNCFTRGLDLIVWVDGQKDALSPLVQAMGKEFLKEYKSLLGSAAEAMQSFLTVDVIDDQDVEKRVGGGAVIASVHTRPTKVWSRFVIQLNADYCGECRICSSVCPFDAISIDPGATAAKIDMDKCQLCGICYSACPAGAIELAYYDFASLDRDVQSSVRTNGLKAIALTCRGSTPTAEEIEDIIGVPGFLPICLPCVGRTPPEFFLKAIRMGIEKIAIIPCKDDHCRFEDGSRIIRSRVLLLRSLLRSLNYDPNILMFRESEGPLATVNSDLCTGCGTCISVCPYGAISAEEKNGEVLFVARVDPDLCQGCGACAASCPSKAIEISRFADQRMISQIEAALAVEPQNSAPRVVGFCCNWCSYGDDDLPFEGLHYSSQNIEVFKVPCVGRIDPLYVLWAFVNGADGVFLGGCHPDDCRYVSGSREADKRVSKLKELLDAWGFDSRRLRLKWLKRDNPEGFSDAIRTFAFQVRQFGKYSIR